MGIDVVDLGRVHFSTAQRGLHAAHRAFALGRRRGDVVGVGVGPVADHLGVDGGAVALGKLQFFQDDDARTLGHDEAVPVLVEGAAGLGGCVVPGGHRAHGDEPAQSERGQRRLCAAGDHRVLVAQPNGPKCFADGVRAGRAGAGGRVVEALGAVADRDLPRRQVPQQFGNEERRDALQAGVQKVDVVFFDAGQPADADADDAADQIFVVGGNGDPGFLHRHLRRGHAVLDEEVHLLDFFFFDEVGRGEVADLASNSRRKVRHVETGQRPDARPPCTQRLPVLFHPGAQRRHRPEPGNHYPTLPVLHGMSRFADLFGVHPAGGFGPRDAS